MNVMLRGTGRGADVLARASLERLLLAREHAL